LGSNISALWILIANSFMQQPVGYVIRDGPAEMTDFFALIFNPNVWVQFPHVVMSGLATAAFFIMGISAYHLLRAGEHRDSFRRSFQIASIVGTLAVIWVIMSGHSQAQHMVQVQPMKMAAAEALWNTEDPAAMSLFTVGDEAERRDVFAIRIPRLLTLLAYNQWEGTVHGINDLQKQYIEQYGPGNYVPPVAVSYWSFRIMVGAGFLLLIASVYGLLLVMGEQLDNPPRLLAFFPWLIFLPYLANTAGWLLTELGRAPWVVFGLMKIEDAVSVVVSSGMVWATLIGFTLVYGVLMVADIYLLRNCARAGAVETAKDVPFEQAPSLVGD
ncbi:MAG TPA: cytochrome ubiquinol oxidase subunit I, partial [Candidatus Binatia bacterium]|nr:cytochrome ubiquinol oxidase subunit I [Candidatus Binatia bacterium]